MHMKTSLKASVR